MVSPVRTAPAHPEHHDDAPHVRTPRSTRPPWVVPAAVGAVTAAATAYTAWQDPNGAGVFPQCPLRVLFGIDCPACGGLRATHALTRLDIAAAADHNVLVLVALPMVLLAWVLWMARGLGHDWFRLPRIPSRAYPALFLGLLVFGVVRNIDGVGLFEYLHSSG